MSAADSQSATIEACDCLTRFGYADNTASALLEGRVAFSLSPVLGRDGGDPVPFASVELLRHAPGWGPQVQVFPHACVTAHLGLAHAARLLHAGIAGRVLVFSFDFVSPFVAAGFHSLKILNGVMPAPFPKRETGSIGLGDGAGFAVLSRRSGGPRIEAHALHNEMFHFTGNTPDGVVLGPDDAVVYATTFAETRALEDYLDGLPAASPQLFQTSIQPGAVQQALIARQQPVARLWPNAGGARIVEDALLCALLEPAERVALVAGEERGTWMLENGIAAARPFAAALVLTRDARDAIGSVKFSPGGSVQAGECPCLEEWVRRLDSCESTAWQSAAGRWAIGWR